MEEKMQSIELAGNGIACVNPCFFRGLIVGTDGTNDVTVEVFNSQDNTGETVYPKNVVGKNAPPAMGIAVWCNKGLYVEISGTGGSCVLYYSD